MTNRQNRLPSAGLKDFRARLWRAAVAGGVAGVLGGVFDFAHLSIYSGFSGQSLAVLVLSGGTLAGLCALCATVLTAAYAVGELLATRFSIISPWAASWVSAGVPALFWAPVLIGVGSKLFEGGLMSQLPRVKWLASGASVLLVLGSVVAAKWVVRMIHWSEAASSRRRVLTLAGSFALLGVLFHALDSVCYRRLYLYLHDCLSVASLGSFALAVRLWRPREPSRHHLVWVGAGLVSILLLVSALCLYSLSSRSSLKALCVERAAAISTVLRHLPLQAKRSRHPGRIGLSQNRFVENHVAGASSLPSFPGASILLITIDALRADRMGIYGHTRRDLTPQLDKWARQEAVVFERAYCPAPHTSYSITSMHTSRYLYQESQLSLPLVYPTIAEALGNAGYQSEAFYTQGIFFTQGEKVGHYRSTNFGFDKVHHGAPDAGPLTEYAKAAVDRIVAADRPGFLWVHYFNVHEPYRSTTFGTSPVDRYDGEIAEADAGAANLIEYARQRLGDQIVIALSADHGEEFKEHGGDYHGSSLYDEQVRVPLMISAPGIGPRRVESAVSTVSLGSTLLGLAGGLAPLSMMGEDLRPAMVTGQTLPRPVFSSVHRKQGVVLLPHKLIVDPTLGTAELYDLNTDPQERVNLFDIQRETSTRLEGLLYEFVEDLGQARTWVDAAMNLGKLRDPRATPDLLRLAMDEEQDLEQRLRALEFLQGLVDRDAASTIAGLLANSHHMIATAAALVLSSAKDPRGSLILREALLDPDPQVRDKASLALAALGDPSAVPTLIDALGRGDMEIRQEAIRALGELQDLEAEEPLIDLLVDIKSKYLVVLALGKIGGPKALDTLVHVLTTDPYADVRGYAVVGLGWLEEPSAIAPLRRVLREEPDIKWTVEALIRLGALGDKGFYGVDARPDDPGLARGFGACQVRPRIITSEFLGRTTCQTLGPRAEVQLHSDIDGESTVIISGKHLLASADEPLPVEISIDGKVLGRVELTAQLGTQRLKAPAGSFKKGKHMVRLQLIAEGALELDHLVVVPVE